MEEDDDTLGESTWGGMSQAITAEGCCPKHPHIQLREVGPDGFVYQKDSCPECDREFQSQKQSLKDRKRELDMQLKQLALEEVPNPSSDEEEEEEKPEAAPEPTPRFQPPPPPQADEGYSNSRPTGNGLTLEALANQMTMMQQMQDWLLQQKEVEMNSLRNKVEAQQKELLQKEVEIALLKEKLSQQETTMKQEIKMAKLTAAARSKSDRSSKKGNKEIHIQELHVQVGATPQADGEFDPKVVQAATKAATTAALQKAAAAAEEQERQEEAAAAAATSGLSKRSHSKHEPKLEKPPPTSRREDNGNIEKSELRKKMKKKEPSKEFTFTPPGMTTSNDKKEEEFDEEESKDQFNPSMPWLAPKLSSKPSKKKSFVNEIQFDPTNMGAKTETPTPKKNRNDIILKPPEAEGGGNLMLGGTGLPTKKAIAEKSGGAPRGVPLDIHHDDDDVPINEDITIGTMDQQYFSGNRSRGFDPYSKNGNFPMHNDEERSVGGMSLGNTVASSTYGEDRQKVVSQTLLDPYGDKGRYSGVVLRSTGMPHGLGRMVYEDDGRTYEGDWRHGRWHGFGRATFANGDSYEGEYRFDQRHGRGKYCWSDGRIYDGEFAEDKRHGKGTFKWPDGATYEGDFHHGQREGHGRYTFSDGGYYSGSWVDGRYEGFGECHWEDGRKYKGEWRAGMAHGQGVETYPDGRVRHDGQWIDDEPIRR